MNSFKTLTKVQGLWLLLSLSSAGCGNAVDGLNSVHALGEQCESNDQCANSATCEPFYIDQDEDGYSSSVVPERLCADASSNPALKTRLEPTSAATRDCADDNGDVHPGQETFFAEPIPGFSGTAAFDYNCDGRAEYIHQAVTEGSLTPPPGSEATCGFAQFQSCNGGQLWLDNKTQCGQPSFLETCGGVFPSTPAFPNVGCLEGDIQQQVVTCR